MVTSYISRNFDLETMDEVVQIIHGLAMTSRKLWCAFGEAVGRVKTLLDAVP